MWKPYWVFTSSLICPVFEGEGRRIELGHHAAAAEEVEIAALRFVRVVFGMLTCQRGEVGAAFGLLQDVFAPSP